MKKGIYILSFACLFTIGTLSTGCGDCENSTEQLDGDESATYQCPMDCEDGKTYEEAGSCPDCKMDLAEVENI